MKIIYLVVSSILTIITLMVFAISFFSISAVMLTNTLVFDSVFSYTAFSFFLGFFVCLFWNLFIKSFLSDKKIEEDDF